MLVGPPTPRYTQADDYPHGGTAEIMEQTLTALRDTRPDFLKALSQGVCHAEVSEHAIDWMWAAFMETSPRADDSLRDLGVVDQRELLPTIQAPTLVCSGDHDAVVDPAIARVAAELLPNARLVHFEGSGHAPFLEERERFNSELMAFVGDPAGSFAGRAGGVVLGSGSLRAAATEEVPYFSIAAVRRVGTCSVGTSRGSYPFSSARATDILWTSSGPS